MAKNPQKETKVASTTAMWRSIIYRKDEKTGEVTKQVTPWKNNLIVDNCYVLQAITFKNEMTGLQYMTFGQGNPAWDPVPPAPSATDTTLYDEIFRYELQAGDFVYLDAGLVVVVGPERRIRVTGVLDYGDAIGSYIREFALFGGNATATLDSGYMANVIRAERFMKTGAIRLEREVILGMGLA